MKNISTKKLTIIFAAILVVCMILTSVITACIVNSKYDSDQNNESNIPSNDSHVHTYVEGICSCGHMEPEHQQPSTPPANVEEDGIKFNTFAWIENDILNEHYFVRLPNSQKVFKLYEHIEVAEGITWSVYEDVECRYPIASKSINLCDGDNICYVLTDDGKNNIAIYTVNIYRNQILTVRFEDLYESIQVEEGQLIPAFPETKPVKTGNEFVGWDYDLKTPVTKSLIINAIWNPTKITVSFITDGGTGSMEPLTVNYGDTIKLPASTFIRDGYSASQWVLSNNSWRSYDFDEEVYITENLEFKVVWKANTNTINLINTKVDGPEHLTQKSCKTGETFNDYNGYEHIGWSTAKNGDVQYKPYEYYESTVYAEQTLYSVWKPIDYTITYYFKTDKDSWGGNTISGVQHSNPITYNVETPTITITAPEILGYTFNSYTSSNISESSGMVIEQGSTGNKSITLYYDRNRVIIYFDANDGTGRSWSQTTYADKTTSLQVLNLTRDGYIFDGWSLSPDGDYKYEASNSWTYAHASFKENVTLYAHWVKGDAKLTFSQSTSGCYGVSDYNGYETHVVVPETYKGEPVVAIWGSAFRDTTIETIELPETIRYIGERAFEGSNLKNIVLSENLETIENYAFRDCTNITHIVLPASLTYVGEGIFLDSGVLKVYCRGSENDEWNALWNKDNAYVLWNYTGDEISN